MNTPDSLHSRDIATSTPHELAILATRDLARASLAPLSVAHPHQNAVAAVRQHMDMLLNVDAPRDPVAEMVSRTLAVNKLLLAVGKRRKVTGTSVLGTAVIENQGFGQMKVAVAGENGVNYEFTVNADGGIEGGYSTPEAADVGAGQMDASALVRVADTLKNLVASN